MKKIVLIILVMSIFQTAWANEYKFQVGDQVELFVYSAEELCGEFRIYADGFVRLPLIGKVEAAGKTEDELNETLSEAIGVYIKNPKITVIPKFSVSVTGYVRNPGVYTITGSERILEAIGLAGGFSPEASQSIVVYRDGEKINISKKSLIKNEPSLGLVKPGDVMIAKRKLITRSDYSVLLSTISVITVAIYYINR